MEQQQATPVMPDALGLAALAVTQFGLRASSDELPEAMTIEFVGRPCVVCGPSCELGHGRVLVQHFARTGEHLFANFATIDGAGRWSL